MKTNKTLIKELRRELHYQQMMLRVDLRAVKAGVAKCKEIGAKMRALQSGSQLTMRAADSGDSPASKPVSSDGGAYCEHGDKAVIDKNTALCVWCGKPPRLPEWFRDELSQLPRRR